MSLSRVRLFATPWIVAYQAPLSMGFSRQEYWSGLPFPSPGHLHNPGIEPRSPSLQANALTSGPPGKPFYMLDVCSCLNIFSRKLFDGSVYEIGEGNGNPLQCSCLENPRDQGAWWAAVYGVSRSQTRLKQLSSSSGSSLWDIKYLSLSWILVFDWQLGGSWLQVKDHLY